MTRLPEDWRLPRNSCYRNARLMSLMYPELREVRGWLVLTGNGREYRMEHAWNEVPAGRIVDSTAWAFDGIMSYRYEEGEP